MSPTSGVIGESWNVYKTHWRHLLPIAFVVYLAVGVLGALLVAVLTWVGAIIAFLISVVALFWLQAALVKAVEDIRDGRADLSLGETFEAARAHLTAVLVAGILARLGIVIGLILVIVPGLWLMTIWAVIIPVIVLESKSAGESFSRSRRARTRPRLGRFRRNRARRSCSYFVFQIVLSADPLARSPTG